MQFYNNFLTLKTSTMGQRASLILAVAAFSTSAVFWHASLGFEEEVSAFENTKQTTIAQARKAVESKGDAVYVEISLTTDIQGKTSANGRPVLCPMSRRQALMCENRVERVIEEMVPAQDMGIRTDGMPVAVPAALTGRFTSCRIHELLGRTVSGDEIFIDDGSGSCARVQASDVNVNELMVESVNVFQPLVGPVEPDVPSAVSVVGAVPVATPHFVGFGDFRVNTIDFLPVMSLGPAHRLLGYQFVERIVPLDIPVLALGEASLDIRGLLLRPPKDPSLPFELSFRPLEQLESIAQSQASFWRALAIFGGVIGVLSIVFGSGVLRSH